MRQRRRFRLVQLLIEEAIQNNLPENAEESRLALQYPVLYQYMKQKLAFGGVLPALQRLGWKKIALYAVTDLMELVLMDLQGLQGAKNDFVLCIGCRNPKKHQGRFPGIPILSAEELAALEKRQDLDGVIVCSLTQENSIFDDLLKSGFPLQKIYSLSELVFG